MNDNIKLGLKENWRQFTLLVIVNGFVGGNTLTHLTKKAENVKVILYTKSISKQLILDIKKVNEQYHNTFEVRELQSSHDRFLIIDRNQLYHIGASLKDLGKKWFAFSKLEGMMESLLTNLLKIKHSGRVEGNKAF